MRTTSTARLLLLALVMSLLVALPQPADAQDGVFDGDAATTERVDAGEPLAAAVQVSRARFTSAPYAVLATVETFADSLAGAALTDRGPLLLTASQSLSSATSDELDRVVEDGGTIYVLGGVDAISADVSDALTSRGFTVDRLAGATRVETAIQIAEEIRRRPSRGGAAAQTVLLARSEGAEGNPTSAWADSVAGGALAAAAGIPILVTPVDAVHPAVAEWLDADAPASTVLLGGEDALHEAIEDQVPSPSRLAGPERTSTAAAVADSPLWPRDDERRFVILEGARDDGWAYGLSAAGIAADSGAPPLMVSSIITPATRRLVSTCGRPEVDLVLAGDDSVISSDLEAQLSDFDGQSCASDFAALSPFADCDQTLEYFIEEGLSRVTAYGLEDFYYGAVEDGIADEEGADGAPAPAPASPTSDAGGGEGGREAVSETNVQEVGVDEPDTVKAVQGAAFVVTGGRVEVMDVSGTAPRAAATIDLPTQAYRHELLVEDDVLVVLSSGDNYQPPPSPTGPETLSVAPPRGAFPEPTTTVSRFDVGTPTAPVALDAAVIDGAYRSARMVGGILHLVATSNPTGLAFTYPADGSEQAVERSLANNREVIQESAIGNWLPGIAIEDAEGALVACDAAFAPPEFSGITTAAVASIDVSESVVPTSAAAVVAQAETLYASTNRLVLTSSQWGQWNDVVPRNSVTTQVHSFDISDTTTTTYVASGQVDGFVLNSFAISEDDGYYRIATTTEAPFDPETGASSTDNGITILTEGGGDLFEVGRVFGLGLGERIFAVRYLGDIAAVVTFRQVDPLYLVDLSNPQAPRVTGELKIPGVSRYLHSLDEDHLLGVGQDGTDDGLLTGLQVSLFDIADRANPTRVASIEYGPGQSLVEFDHKAFLHWAPLGRAFIPADLYDRGDYDTLVIDIDAAASSLSAVGSLTAPPESYQASSRTFIIGDRVFAVHTAGVSVHDLVTLDQQGFGAFPPSSAEECCVGPEPGGPPPAEDGPTPPGQ